MKSNLIKLVQEVEAMVSMWEPLVQAMASFQSSSCEDKLGLVRQLEAGASLHPHHSLVRDYVELATYIREVFTMKTLLRHDAKSFFNCGSTSG